MAGPAYVSIIQRFHCSVYLFLVMQTWFEKTPLGKKRKKAAQGDDADAGAKKGKKGKKGKK